MKRRLFLGLSAFAAAHMMTRNLYAAVKAGPEEAGADTLAAFLDTLLPAYEDSPSASEFDIAGKILAKAASEPQYARLIKAGTHWLDSNSKKQFGQSFASLPEDDRERVVETMPRARAKSLPNVFFNVLWEDSRQAFYSDPRAWAALGYAGPPQPVGFPDHSKAPHGMQP